MNLIPFVLILITILSLFSLTHFESAVVRKKESQIYLAYFKGLRETRSQKATVAYEKSLPEKERPSQFPSMSSPKNPFTTSTHFRTARIGWDQGKLNLSSLISNSHKPSLLKTVCIKYLKELYGHADFFPKQKSFPEALLDVLIESYQKADLSTPFYHVTLRNKEFQSVFYKMVRGTHTYDLDKKIGYPPFGDMFTFAKKDSPPMNFHYANPSFLSAILGEGLKKEFIELEKRHLQKARSQCRSPIKKSEFKDFLRDHKIEEGPQLLSLFDFKYCASERHPEKYRDPETQITVKVN